MTILRVPSRPGLHLSPQAPQPATKIPAKVHPGRVSGTIQAPKCHHITPRSTKKPSLGANIPQNSSQDAPATPPSTPRMQKTFKNHWFFNGFCYPTHVQNLPQNDPKSNSKPLKLAILGSNNAHVSFNLVLSWHILPPTWPQLNPSWRQVGGTSPILGQSSPLTSASWSHFGPSSRQGTILGQFWDHFDTILGLFGPIWRGFRNQC